MENTNLIEKITYFGLGRQEAIIYMELLKLGPMNGYEVAKRTGISRSNVYNALYSLVEHGAAYIEETDSVKYVPVKVEEFCDNRIRKLEREKEEIISLTPKMETQSQGYITIEGREKIDDKIHHILLDTKQRVYFAARVEYIDKYQEEIDILLKKDIKVVVISEDEPDIYKKNKEKILFYRNLNEMAEWKKEDVAIRLITDSAYALTGEVCGENGSCIYSSQKNFVRVIKEALSNEIKLIEMNK